MAIGIQFGNISGSLGGGASAGSGSSGDAFFGKSKWWGFPDMPEDLEYPEVPVRDEYVDEDGKDAVDEYDDPLTFICQIRCSDLAALDPKGLLPHEGMLYFFGSLDYFLGTLDAALSPGMGEWEAPFFKVLYSPTCDNLHTHSILYDDGSEACLPAVPLTFSAVGSMDDGFRLLGKPFYEEVQQDLPGMISLLQIDGNDDWDLRFFDCGMLNFLISPADLAARRWDCTRCYLHSA